MQKQKKHSKTRVPTNGQKGKVCYGMSGVGNKIFHQHIISDLIYGVRKKWAKEKENRYYALSEISISELGYEYGLDKDLRHNHNFDLAIVEKRGNNVKMIFEVERSESSHKKTLKKIKECLASMSTLKEVFIVKFNQDGKAGFYKCVLEKNKVKELRQSSKSVFLNTVMKPMLVSLK